MERFSSHVKDQEKKKYFPRRLMADAVKWKSILKASWGKLVLGRVGGRPQGRVNGSGPLGQQWPTGVNITCTASVAARVQQPLPSASVAMRPSRSPRGG